MCLLRELANRLDEQISKSEALLPSTDEEEYRSVFQKEYHKVIFSDYFRSLANKTQVVPLPDNDHTHTRLTLNFVAKTINNFK